MFLGFIPLEVNTILLKEVAILSIIVETIKGGLGKIMDQAWFELIFGIWI